MPLQDLTEKQGTYWETTWETKWETQPDPWLEKISQSGSGRQNARQFKMGHTARDKAGSTPGQDLKEEWET